MGVCHNYMLHTLQKMAVEEAGLGMSLVENVWRSLKQTSVTTTLYCSIPLDMFAGRNKISLEILNRLSTVVCTVE